MWNFSVRAPSFDRWLYLWMHRLGRMGREEAAFFSESIRPGMHVADVGANIGLYSLFLARCTGPTGRVYSFEPDALMASTLRQNLTNNHAAHVEVFECAVGAAKGEIILQRNAMNSGDNRVGQNTGSALHNEQISVPICTKMDVQGWEGEALKGIADLLDANPRLQVYFEFWPHGLRLAGTEISQLADTLSQLKLHVTLADTPDQDSPVDLLELDRKMAPKAFTNLLAHRL